MNPLTLQRLLNWMTETELTNFTEVAELDDGN